MMARMSQGEAAIAALAEIPLPSLDVMLCLVARLPPLAPCEERTAGPGPSAEPENITCPSGLTVGLCGRGRRAKRASEGGAP